MQQMPTSNAPRRERGGDGSTGRSSSSTISARTATVATPVDCSPGGGARNVMLDGHGVFHDKRGVYPPVPGQGPAARHRRPVGVDRGDPAQRALSPFTSFAASARFRQAASVQGRARIERAKHVLAVSDFSVTDVCMEVGFTSLGSFSDLFARRVGASPTAYRRAVRSKMPAPRTLPVEMIPGCLTLMGAAFAISEKQSPALLSDSTASSAGAREDS